MSVLPTHVGMSRRAEFVGDLGVSAPHTRGDEPRRWWVSPVRVWCSPHTWG